MSAAAHGLVSGLLDWFDTWPRETPAAPAGWTMSNSLHPYDYLFAPLTVNRLTLASRIIMGPMGNLSMADPSGRPSDEMIACFEARATAGARFFTQLTPGLGRVGSPDWLMQRRKLPVSAAWHPNVHVPEVPCRPLLDRELRRIVRDIGQAAIDGVQLHGHEGYLLGQFVDQSFNRRRLGRYADVQRLGLDLVAEIRQRCGPAFPIMYRIDLSLALRGTDGDRMETEPALRGFCAERSVGETLACISSLVGAGVDMIDVDFGSYENWWLPHSPGPMRPGAFLRVARCVKDHLATQGAAAGNTAAVPVAAIGKLGYPDIAERALREGMCAPVMLVRPLLAVPDWPRKARGGHIQSSGKPITGFDAKHPADPALARRPRRIAVVGAGPAGTTAACPAAARGHAVTLLEVGERIGDWLRVESAPAIRFDVANYPAHLVHRLASAVLADRVEFRRDNPATAEGLKAEGFDVILCCTGLSPLLPRLAQDAPLPTAPAVDVLPGPRRVAGARRIVVSGGGDMGCETAHVLAFEQGKAVTIVEQAETFMRGSCTANLGYLLRALARQGTRLLPATRVTGFRAEGVELMANTSGRVPNPGAVWRAVLPRNIHDPFARDPALAEAPAFVEADMVVFAVAVTPDAALYRACIERHAAADISSIEECFRVGGTVDATKSAMPLRRPFDSGDEDQPRGERRRLQRSPPNLRRPVARQRYPRVAASRCAAAITPARGWAWKAPRQPTSSGLVAATDGGCHVLLGYCQLHGWCDAGRGGRRDATMRPVMAGGATRGLPTVVRHATDDRGCALAPAKW